MEHKASSARSDLEQMLINETAEPKALPLSLLVDVTGDFSDDQEVGRGGFAVVYKGILGDRAVAVKRLSKAYMHEKEFHREVQCLIRAKHKNVVRFLGYCADTQGSMERYNGEFVMADVRQRLLCFEYIPRGSLDNYIIDPSLQQILVSTSYMNTEPTCVKLLLLHHNYVETYLFQLTHPLEVWYYYFHEGTFDRSRTSCTGPKVCLFTLQEKGLWHGSDGLSNAMLPYIGIDLSHISAPPSLFRDVLVIILYFVGYLVYLVQKSACE